MGKTGKILAWVAGIGVVIGIGAYAMNKKANRLKSMLTIRLGNISNIKRYGNGIFGGIEGDVKIEFINPSDTSINIDIETIKIYRGDSQVSQTTAPRKSFTLAKTATAGTTLTFQVSFTDIIKQLKNFTNATILTADIKKVGADFYKDIVVKVFLKANNLPIEYVIKPGEEKEENINGFEGLALSAGKRDILDGRAFDRYIAKPDGTKIIVSQNYNVNNVVIKCKEIVSKYHKQVEALAKYIKKHAKTDYQFCKDIFGFCYTYMQYENDKPGTEELRTPARSWYDAQVTGKGIDCDDFSIFVASLLVCAGIDYKFRIVKYNNKPNFQHIYCVALINGREVPIDPVIDRFDYEKTYTEKKDF
ncbi:MAG: hypothetical protein SNJ71_00270 [Bacteroidales bacterium]